MKGAMENSLRLATRMTSLALAAGIEPDEILDGLGLPLGTMDLCDGKIGRLNAEDLRSLGSRLASILARHASLAEGRMPIRPPDWRVLLYSLLSGRTLRDAILHGGDACEAIDGRCGRMTLRENGAIGEVRLDSLRPGSTLTGCAVDLNGVASIHGLCSWLLGQSLPLRSIHLAYDEDMFDRLDLGGLPYPVVLSAAWTGFSFPATWLDHPVVRSASELPTRQTQSFLFDVGSEIGVLPLAEQVRRLTIQALRLHHRLPSFAEVSARLGRSVPTLRRHLAMGGSSYRSIKASCRRELGLELLRQGHLSIEDIAARLDFCDSDAFRIAFRGWFGKSPNMYRLEAHRAEAATCGLAAVPVNR